MRHGLVLAAALSGAALTAGCGLLLDFGHLEGGTGGSTSSSASSSGTTSSSATTSTTTSTTSGSMGGGGGGSTSSTTGIGSSTSSTTSTTSSTSTGMTMPPVAIMKDGGAPDGAALDYRIGATEVTTAQYDAFVKSYEANPMAQRDVCWWNHSVRPNVSPPNDAGIGTSTECQSYDFEAEVIAHPNAPVRCVDWCDAATYCQWAGGFMCHGNEGVNTYLPEWETACRGPNNHKFPYGATYQAGSCVDNTIGTQPLDVHSKATCEGGYPGIFDMSGNVAEWVDCGCEYDNGDSTTTSAFVGGGGFKDSNDSLDCTPARTEFIVSFHVDIGIRCCFTP